MSFRWVVRNDSGYVRGHSPPTFIRGSPNIIAGASCSTGELSPYFDVESFSSYGQSRQAAYLESCPVTGGRWQMT